LRGRRAVLGTLVTALAGVGGCSSLGESEDSARLPETRSAREGKGTAIGRTSRESWLADVDNYDGYVDATDRSTVEVAVGTEGNRGDHGFDPPAVFVRTGTKVTWRWTGAGGDHGIVHRGGAFESAVTDAAGYTFAHTFEESAVYRYHCPVHRTDGMKGVVAVKP
jgi:halocyanin-like protein